MANSDYITSHVVLPTRSENVDGINMKLIERFSEPQMVYYSFDSVVDDPNNFYPLGHVRFALNPCGLGGIGCVSIPNKSKSFTIFSNPIQSTWDRNNRTSP
jgi:hypothetical protein